MRFTRFCRPSLLVLVFGVAMISGCLPGVAWLPDSSGFVYTEGNNFKQLCFYDVAKGQKRVLVADTQAATNWPALSPDGKQVAVTRIKKQGDNSELAQVVIYDLQGKELHRSAEFAWREPPVTGSGGEDPAPAAAHWSRDGKKLVVHDYHDKKARSAIYDPATGKSKLIEGTASAIGGTPVRPDGKAFVVSRSKDDGSFAMFVVDWEGKEQPIPLEPAVADENEKRLLLVYPMFGMSRWDGPVATITFGTWRFRLDTEKHVGTFANVPPAEALVGEREIVQQHKFADGAGARVLREKDATGKEKYRLEFLVTGVKDPMLFLEKPDGMFLFAPSPDGKHLAIRYTADGNEGNKQRIIVLDAKGQIERTVEVEQ